MSDAPGSLDNLRGLALPPETSFWPPAAGLWILAAAVVAALAVLAWRAVQRYRAAAYRRAAITELEVISAGIDRNDPAIVERISDVMKRVAMVDYGRAQVASLSGQAWADFVATEASEGFDAATIRRLLMETFEAGREPKASELRLLVGHAELWVRAHRAPQKAEA